MDDSQNYTKIKEMCLKNGISEGRTSREYLFTINSVDYFYYNKNIGEMDIVEGFVDGNNDGGIDYILNKDDKMYLIQGKSSSNLSIEDIKNVFYKICDTIEKFDKNDFDGFNSRLKSVYLNRYDDLDENKNMELVLFTNTILDNKVISELEKFKNTERMSNYTITIYDKNDIDKKKIMLFQGEEFVREDSIELYETNNFLKYNEGLIVNIKATSLKKLYLKHNDKGLFSYNLREHISQKNVDSGIDDTIKNDPKNFWFYNNGITIGCVDYILDGNKIKLYDFSIINGAQTTSKIGTSKLVDNNNDFAIVCKIVKANGTLSNSSDFISKISEASNSQKPIRPRDLKSNSIEQKRLQYGSSQNKYPLAIEIKRGVKPLNDKKVDHKWQRVTNEYVGQLILACTFQKPGTARSGKSAIFSSDKIYNKVYKRTHDYNTLYEYVKIANIYDDFKFKYLKEEADQRRLGISQNGKFTILSILFYLYKRLYCNVSGWNDTNVNEDNIEGLLTLNYHEDDYEEKLNFLFKFIIKKLSDLYSIKEKELNLTSYSNFFKTDKTYTDIILREIDTILEDEYDFDKIKKYMNIFEGEKQCTII